MDQEWKLNVWGLGFRVGGHMYFLELSVLPEKTLGKSGPGIKSRTPKQNFWDSSSHPASHRPNPKIKHTFPKF